MWFRHNSESGGKGLQPGFVRGFSIGLGMMLLVLGGALAFHSSRDVHATGATAVEASPAGAAALRQLPYELLHPRHKSLHDPAPAELSEFLGVRLRTS